MSAKASAPVPSHGVESNPLFMFEKGLKPAANLPLHRESAAVGNLFFEYVQNVPTLRGIVRSGRQVAEYLESKGLIAWLRIPAKPGVRSGCKPGIDSGASRGLLPA